MDCPVLASPGGGPGVCGHLSPPPTLATGAHRNVSALALPPPLLVLLPVGRLAAGGLDRPPAAAGGGDGLLVVAVEQDHEALVAGGIGGQVRAFDEEADPGAVGVLGAERQKDRLVGGVRLPVAAMRQ